MSFLSSIFAPGEQERSDELDRQRLALEQKRYERGLITAQQLEANQAKIAGDRLNVATELDTAFGEGLQEGYDSTTGAIKKTIAAPFNFAWDIIPWQVWIAGGIALFFWMGGGAFLKGRLK